MAFLPISQRELRAAARRGRTYWMRTLLAGGVSIVWLWLLASGGGEVGRPLFVGIGEVALGLGLLAGVFLTADCLSEEHREGTLGLLFLTELRSYDVVIGKLIATSLPVFYGLVSLLPLLGLSLLIGGVTAGECWRSALVLVLTLVWSLCLGLAVSAFNREARTAVSATLLIVVLLGGALPAAGWLQVSLTHTSPSHHHFLLSPVALYLSAFENAYRAPGGAPEFWLSFASVSGMAALAFAVACLVVPRVWREGNTVWGGRGTRSWRWRCRFGGQTARSRRRKFLDQNPYLWLASRDRRLTWAGTAACLCLFCVWLGFLWGCWSPNPGRSSSCFVGAVVVAWALHWAVKWTAATQATRRLNEDRRSGLLALLAVTTLSVEDILQGQTRAVRRALLVPVTLALLTNAGLLWMLFSDRPTGYTSGDVRIALGGAVLGGAIMMLIDIQTLLWVGMSAGFREKHHHHAVWSALQPVLVLPLLLLLGMWVLGAFYVAGVLVTNLFWFVISVAIDLSAMRAAFVYLHNDLRRPDQDERERAVTEASPDPCGTIQVALPRPAPPGLRVRQREVQDAVTFIESVLFPAGFEYDPVVIAPGDENTASGYAWRDRGGVTSAWASIFVMGSSVIVTFTESARSGRHATAKLLGLLYRDLVQRYGGERVQVLGVEQPTTNSGLFLGVRDP